MSNDIEKNNQNQSAINQSKVSFTEEMKGFITHGETDFDRGFRSGKEAGTSIMFHLTISANNVERFIADHKHATEDVKGYIECPSLGSGQLPVERAWFNLFVDDHDRDRKVMLYRLFFRDQAGQELTLSGYKNIKDDPGFDLWSDTTTLFTRILKGHVNEQEEKAAGNNEPEIIASGIIHIYFFDFLKQLTTFHAEADSLADRVAVLTAFGKLFMGKLWEVYAPQILASHPPRADAE